MRRETFDTPGPLELNVRVPSGDVDLETAEGTESVVEISASPEIEEEARVELHSKRDGHELSVVIEKRSGLFRAFRDDVRVRIKTPPGADVELSTASADIDARGDFGATKVNTASGDVRFEHVGGEAQVNSASGDVNLDQVDGALTVNTASGDVEIRRLQGEGKVRAASGDISIDEAASSLKVQTASGDVGVDSMRRIRPWRLVPASNPPMASVFTNVNSTMFDAEVYANAVGVRVCPCEPSVVMRTPGWATASAVRSITPTALAL